MAGTAGGGHPDSGPDVNPDWIMPAAKVVAPDPEWVSARTSFGAVANTLDQRDAMLRALRRRGVDCSVPPRKLLTGLLGKHDECQLVRDQRDGNRQHWRWHRDDWRVVCDTDNWWLQVRTGQERLARSAVLAQRALAAEFKLPPWCDVTGEFHDELPRDVMRIANTLRAAAGASPHGDSIGARVLCDVLAEPPVEAALMGGRVLGSKLVANWHLTYRGSIGGDPHYTLGGRVAWIDVAEALLAAAAEMRLEVGHGE